MFINNWTNKSKEMLLSLCEYICIGCIATIAALASLLVNGKHAPELYLLFIFIDLGILTGILVFSWLVRRSLTTIDDWEEKKKLKEIECNFKQLEIEELKLKKGG